MSRDAVLAVDVGGTKTAVALVTADGRIVEQVAAPTPASEGPAAVVRTIVELARLLHERRPELAVTTAGVGTAGVVDRATGTITASTDTFRAWAGTPLAALLADGLVPAVGASGPLAVHVQNDVDAFAVGESVFGAAAGASSALVVAVGTGVGGALLIDGRVHRGARQVAGDIGHVPVPGAEQLVCTCGRSGHLEAIGSGLGIVQHFRALGGPVEVGDARGVTERAAAGDGLARRSLEGSARAVGRVLAGASALLDPERLIVVGGVSAAGEIWWRPMREAFAAERITALVGLEPLPSALGGSAALLGAAWSARDAIGVAA